MNLQCVWLPNCSDGSAALWLDAAPISSTAVLVVPGLGYTFSSGYRFSTSLSAELQRRGSSSARLHFAGTGDGTGPLPSLATLRASIISAVEFLVAQGANEIVLVGLEFGASLALEVYSPHVRQVVAIGPVFAGRRYARQLSMLSDTADDGTLYHGGYPISAQLHTELAAWTWKPPRSEQSEPERLIMGTTRGKIPADLADANGTTVADEPSLSEFFSTPSESVPELGPSVTQVVEWIETSTTHHAPHTAAEPRPHQHSVANINSEMCERSITVTDRALTGVQTYSTTQQTDEPEVVVLLLNSGSDPHTGSGRMWVDAARSIASATTEVFRMDYSGWGESIDDRVVPLPYATDALDDTALLLQHFRDQYPSATLMAVGLCAGAWLAMEAAYIGAPVDSIVAVNLQSYWQMGDPVEPTIDETRRRRTDEIARIKKEGRDREREHPDDGSTPALRWLTSLQRTGVTTRLLFADGDDGIEYLTDSLGARLDDLADCQTLTIRVVPGLNHGITTGAARTTLITELSTAVSAHTGRALTLLSASDR